MSWFLEEYKKKNVLQFTNLQNGTLVRPESSSEFGERSHIMG
jgi:hypothetical protein